MRGRFRTASLALSMAMLATLAFWGAASAAESRILRATYVGGEAQIVDVTVSRVIFEAETREITLTGRLRCDPGFNVWFVETEARQSSGSASTFGSSTLVDPPCDAPFTAVLAASEGSFRPGRVTIDVLAFACALRCGEETLRVEAVLIP